MSAATQRRQPSAVDVDAMMDLVRGRGGRASTARRVILETLQAAGGHRTAEQLAAEVQAAHPEIHESTVYRNLDRFEELGVTYHTHLGHGPAQWHLVTSPHCHLTCQTCGAVIEAAPAIFATLQTELHDRLGFDADLRHFAVTGTCHHCQNRSGQ
jgi:Fur family ferric uptake transcriptional regulator